MESDYKNKQRRRRSMRTLRRRSEILPFNLDVEEVSIDEKKEPEKDEDASGQNQEDVYGSLWMETNEPVIRKKKRRSSLFATMYHQPLLLESQIEQITDSTDLGCSLAVPHSQNGSKSPIDSIQVDSAESYRNVCLLDSHLQKNIQTEDCLSPTSKSGETYCETAFEIHTGAGATPPNFDNKNRITTSMSPVVTPPNLNDKIGTPTSMSPEYPESPDGLYQSSREDSYLASVCGLDENSQKSTCKVKSDLNCDQSPLSTSNKENSISENNQMVMANNSVLSEEQAKTPVDGECTKTSPGFFSLSTAIGKVVDFVKTSPSYLFGIVSDNSKAELTASPALKPNLKDNVMSASMSSLSNIFEGQVGIRTTVCINDNTKSLHTTKVALPAKEKREVFLDTYNAMMNMFQKTQSDRKTELKTHSNQPETNKESKDNVPCVSSQHFVENDGYLTTKLDTLVENTHNESISTLEQYKCGKDSLGSQVMTTFHVEGNVDKTNLSSMASDLTVNNTRESPPKKTITYYDQISRTPIDNKTFVESCESNSEIKIADRSNIDIHIEQRKLVDSDTFSVVEQNDGFKNHEDKLNMKQNVTVTKRRGRRSVDKSSSASCVDLKVEGPEYANLIDEKWEALCHVDKIDIDESYTAVNSGRRKSRRSKDNITLRAEIKSIGNIDQISSENILACETGDNKRAKDDNEKTKKSASRKRKRSADVALLKPQDEQESTDSNDNANNALISVKKLKTDNTETVSELEKLCRNKNYIKPEEHKPWPTIFECEDRYGNSMGKKRMQRYVNFEKPAQMKLRRRQQRAIKNGWNTLSRKRKAFNDEYVQDKLSKLWSELDRSSPETPSLQDKLRKIVETE